MRKVCQMAPGASACGHVPLRSVPEKVRVPHPKVFQRKSLPPKKLQTAPKRGVPKNVHLGDNVVDTDGDEDDGKDEAFVLMDQSAGGSTSRGPVLKSFIRPFPFHRMHV